MVLIEGGGFAKKREETLWVLYDHFQMCDRNNVEGEALAIGEHYLML